MHLRDMMERYISGWMQIDGPESDVVLSSRIRLARNLRDRMFPNHTNDDENKAVLAVIENAVETLKKQKKADGIAGADWVRISDLSLVDRQVMMEKHLISPQHIQDPKNKAVLLTPEETISVMINEEDHIRIQSILAGLQLRNAYDMAGNVDDILESVLDYAYSDKIGYITSCPTNLGTGMRASVMVHLPALALSNRLAGVMNTVSRVGLAVRGLFGEGTESVGNIFQISNQITLGHSEEDIIDNLLLVTKQIVDHERTAREALMRDVKTQLEDKVGRAYGILTNARILSTQEAMSQLSDVKLGIDMGIIKGIDPKIFTELMVLTRPAHLQKFIGTELTPEDRDIHRASLVREGFKS